MLSIIELGNFDKKTFGEVPQRSRVSIQKYENSQGQTRKTFPPSSTGYPHSAGGNNLEYGLILKIFTSG
jgi:hypothetical protein